MGRVRSKDTGPELTLRRLLFAAGYRYRLHGQGLQGRPDIVFKGRRRVIFVHGCFWHRHQNCHLARLPKSKVDFWTAKFERNRERDAATEKALADEGWKVLVVWECELADLDALLSRVTAFLND